MSNDDVPGRPFQASLKALLAHQDQLQKIALSAASDAGIVEAQAAAAEASSGLIAKVEAAQAAAAETSAGVIARVEAAQATAASQLRKEIEASVTFNESLQTSVSRQVADAARRLEATLASLPVQEMERQITSIQRISDDLAGPIVGRWVQRSALLDTFRMPLEQFMPSVNTDLIGRFASTPLSDFDELTEDIINEAERIVADLSEGGAEALRNAAEAIGEDGASLVSSLGTRARTWWDKSSKMEKLVLIYVCYVVLMVILTCVTGIVVAQPAPTAGILNPAGSVQGLFGGVAIGAATAVVSRQARDSQERPDG
jgi:hypothetical protein